VSGFLLDTNVPSELTRPAPAPQIVRWVASQAGTGFHLSVISVGELQKGFTLLSPGKRRTELERWFEDHLIPLFAGRILPVTHAIASSWGRLSAERQQQGAAMSTSDGLIAATALEHGQTVVTRNVKDFAGLGITVLNPWETG
jgi:predicted nucleic acid-binding protein